MADSKTALLTEKKSTLLESLGSFAGQALLAYQASKAPPATIVAAPPPPAPARISPTLVIAGAALFGFVLLRKH